MIQLHGLNIIILVACMAGCFATPSLALAWGVLALGVFCVSLRRRGQQLTNNLVVVVAVFSLIIAVTYSPLGLAMLGSANFTADSTIEVRRWTTKYICLIALGLILGACLLSQRPRWLMRQRATVTRRREMLTVYLIAGFIPLVAVMVLYLFRFRGAEYVEIHRAALGPLKYILFSILLTHGALILLFDAFSLMTRREHVLLSCMTFLFIVVYGLLLPMRSNLFALLMYGVYYFSRKITLQWKIALAVVSIVGFTWVALHRNDVSEQPMGLGEGTIYLFTGNNIFADMVPWAQDITQAEGYALGSTYWHGFVAPEQQPSVRYAKEMAPLFFDEGGGFGFFYAAELFLNFGYWGGVMAAIGLGFVLEIISTSTSVIIRTSVLPALLGSSFALVRNDFCSAIKSPIYIVLSVLLLYHVAQYVCSAKRRKMLSSY